MGLFAGLRARRGWLRGGWRRDRTSRAGGASGERPLCQKVNAARRAQALEIAKVEKYIHRT